MKSLDINSKNTDLNTNLSNSNRTVTIEFTGGIQIGRLTRGRLQSVTVPYRSFAQRLKAIQRLGGKIVNISIHNCRLKSLDIRQDLTVETVATPAIAPIAPIVDPEIQSSPVIVEAPEVSLDISESTPEVAEEPEVNSEVDVEAVAINSRISEEPEAPESPEILGALQESSEIETISDSPEIPEIPELSEVSPIAEAPEKAESISEVVPEIINTIEHELIEHEPIEHEPKASVELANFDSSPIAEPKKKKVATESLVKIKKPKASKSSQGFSRMPKHQEPQLVSVSQAIAPTHTNEEPVLAPVFIEAVAEHLPNEVALVTEVQAPVVAEESPIAIAPVPTIEESKPEVVSTNTKKTKASTKSGGGFNKLKKSTKKS